MFLPSKPATGASVSDRTVVACNRNPDDAGAPDDWWCCCCCSQDGLATRGMFDADADADTDVESCTLMQILTHRDKEIELEIKRARGGAKVPVTIGEGAMIG